MPTHQPEWPPRALKRLPLGFVPSAGTSTLTLTDEQRSVAAQLATSDRILVSGVSGSGKTHLAVEFAKGNAAIGKSVLYLCPRKPLADWLAMALERHQVVVQTVHRCMETCLSTKSSIALPRAHFDDRVFIDAATEAVEPGSYDLVLVDEWQTLSDGERAFVARLSSRSVFVALEDPTRALYGASRQALPDLDVLFLTEGFRARDGVARLDGLYAAEGFDPFPTPMAATKVLVSVLEDPDALEQRIREAVVALWRRGFAQGEVGIVSGLARTKSALATCLRTPAFSPRSFALTEAPSRAGLACDSFAYWLGLERRAIVLSEFPSDLGDRRKKFHVGLSRACEEAHIILSRADIESDPTLVSWVEAIKSLR
jgi:hypothetical protein